MKKIITVGITLLLGLSTIGCTAKQEVMLGAKVSQEEKATKAEEKNTIENYTKLIGLSKEEIIDVMGEEATPIDEGGLEFSNAGIRVWFGEDGKNVSQIFMNSSDIDFNGARIGEKIEDFKSVFGKSVLEDTGSAYSNFDYEGLILHVQYDPSTKQVIAVYLMDEWE
ncbi:hypothetical protein GOM49_04610 [Clostridium bovifaecis]|uniref:DUF4309 domain-containing protein n=1 Tax=Clostridium bovifaecis TaxID=2184719 RepID=A0A6I6F258_9CLOT|nr:hypothetical protein GOM49_04610 [Clostridium bovifaecis]